MTMVTFASATNLGIQDTSNVGIASSSNIDKGFSARYYSISIYRWDTQLYALCTPLYRCRTNIIVISGRLGSIWGPAQFS